MKKIDDRKAQKNDSKYTTERNTVKILLRLIKFSGFMDIYLLRNHVRVFALVFSRLTRFRWENIYTFLLFRNITKTKRVKLLSKKCF